MNVIGKELKKAHNKDVPLEKLWLRTLIHNQQKAAKQEEAFQDLILPVDVVADSLNSLKRSDMLPGLRGYSPQLASQLGVIVRGHHYSYMRFISVNMATDKITNIELMLDGVVDEPGRLCSRFTIVGPKSASEEVQSASSQVNICIVCGLVFSNDGTLCGHYARNHLGLLAVPIVASHSWILPS